MLLILCYINVLERLRHQGHHFVPIPNKFSNKFPNKFPNKVSNKVPNNVPNKVRNMSVFYNVLPSVVYQLLVWELLLIVETPCFETRSTEILWRAMQGLSFSFHTKNLSYSYTCNIQTDTSNVRTRYVLRARASL